MAEFFAGSGGTAAAVRSQGFCAKEWDVLHGPDGDLTRPAVRAQIRRDARDALLIAALFAPPCGTFSTARDRSGAIRSRQFPWGIPDAAEVDQIKIDMSNECWLATIELVRYFHKLKIPGVLENPHSS